jgi:prevent-host-death family protein
VQAKIATDRFHGIARLDSHSDGYVLGMGSHSVAEAKNRLPKLIDRTLKGEGVIITRHGRPVVELKPIPEPARPVSPVDLDWPAARRVKVSGAKKNAAEFVSAMRDEENR